MPMPALISITTTSASARAETAETAIIAAENHQESHAMIIAES
jgi:hypothetical protein